MTVAAPTQTFPHAQAVFDVREVDLSTVDLTFVRRWRHLESRSIEGNAFRSPDLVLPALRLPDHSRDKPFGLAVESANGDLLGLGVFEESRGSRLLPLTHLRSWQSDYSLFDGLLVDRNAAHDVLTSLFRFVAGDSRWNGIGFEDRSSDSVLSTELDRAAETIGTAWHEDWSVDRAVIPVSEIPDDGFASLYSKSRRKTLKQSIRRLQSRGAVSYALHIPEAGETRAVDEFLRLEALGWKGEQGTAMAVDPAHTQFCRDLVGGFAENSRAVFGELKVDGRIVASTLNLLAGDTLFAVKIGWDPEFADCSPGTLSELSLLQHCRELSGIRQIDSCAKPGSYVGKVWPWRTTLTTGVFTTSMTGTLAASALGRIKQLKRLLK